MSSYDDILYLRIQTKGKATVDRNMPAMSGQLRWATELKGKMSFSVKSFKELNHPICYREGAKLVFKKYKETMGQLTSYEDDVFQLWNLGISKKMIQSLNRSLIIRNTDKGTLKVNFARELTSLLREVSLVYEANHLESNTFFCLSYFFVIRTFITIFFEGSMFEKRI